MRPKIEWCLICFFCFGAFIPSIVSGKALTIGKVDKDPEKTYHQLKPMVDYVVRHLKEFGYTEGKVIIVNTTKDMVQKLREGSVDWVQKGAYQSFIYEKEGVGEITLRTWREGVPYFIPVIFVRKESKISSLKDLKGKTIVFENEGSTPGFFLQASAIIRDGLDMQRLNSPDEKPATGKVGYVFAGDELSNAVWVQKGIAHAGTYHLMGFESDKWIPEAVRKDLKIIYKGQSVPRIMETLRKGLAPAVKKKIKQVLLKIHEDPSPEAKEALKKYGPETAKFDEFIGDAKKELDEAADLMKYFNKLGVSYK